VTIKDCAGSNSPTPPAGAVPNSGVGLLLLLAAVFALFVGSDDSLGINDCDAGGCGVVFGVLQLNVGGRVFDFSLA